MDLLVQLFQRELGSLFPAASVFAADLRPEISSACQLADRSFAVPPISDSRYLEQVLALCQQHEVGLLVPTIDTELILLAEHRELFEQQGTHVLVSDTSLVRQCRDKRLTTDLFAQYKVESPRVVQPTADAPYPLFAKPYDGSSEQQLVCCELLCRRYASTTRRPKTDFVTNICRRWSMTNSPSTFILIDTAACNAWSPD